MANGGMQSGIAVMALNTRRPLDPQRRTKIVHLNLVLPAAVAAQVALASAGQRAPVTPREAASLLWSSPAASYVDGSDDGWLGINHVPALLDAVRRLRLLPRETGRVASNSCGIWQPGPAGPGSELAAALAQDSTIDLLNDVLLIFKYAAAGRRRPVGDAADVYRFARAVVDPAGGPAEPPDVVAWLTAPLTGPATMARPERHPPPSRPDGHVEGGHPGGGWQYPPLPTVDLGTARARAALAATERTLTAVERVNAALLAAGQAYPAFFATLRGHLADVSRAARAAGDPAGLWRRSGRRPQRRRHHGGPRRPAAAGRLAQTVRRIVPYLAAGFPDFDGCDAWRRADPVNRDDPCPCSTGSNEATCTTSSAPTVTASSSPPGPNSCEVVVTAPGLEWLATFTRQLVDDHLAASGHNIVPIRSIYLWHGTVYDRTEARVALHTRTSLVSRIVDRANAKHPHDIPCVIALPIVSGNPSYVRWILDETTES